MSSIILIMSFILEGVVSLYIPFNLNNINIYYPSLTLVSIVSCYPLFNHKRKFDFYYLVVIIIGICYDLVYTDVFILNSLLFFISALIVSKFYLKFDVNNYMFLLLCLIIITNYNAVYYFILVLYQHMHFDLFMLLYKIVNSYFLNLLYGYILYLLILKYKRKKQLIHK